MTVNQLLKGEERMNNQKTITTNDLIEMINNHRGEFIIYLDFSEYLTETVNEGNKNDK